MKRTIFAENTKTKQQISENNQHNIRSKQELSDERICPHMHRIAISFCDLDGPLAVGWTRPWALTLRHPCMSKHFRGALGDRDSHPLSVS
ncbi:hypothetical protein JTE90_016656 [Oedothorax gibbosus]|uniref:Uncharacterized protein n=1 Tax=Oedothorax gibbosus TaxID=931172 RepID=A0AAV6V5E3_9ARAC|nr:hypothetical protein JTE90_016656 [Oedothorax gibbosus]